MVVFEDGLARKSEYRRFAIKGTDGTDDVASIHEVDHPAVPPLPGRAREDGRAGRARRPEADQDSAGAEAGDGDGQRKFAYPPNLVVVDGGPAAGRGGRARAGRARASTTSPSAAWPSGWRRSGCPARTTRSSCPAAARGCTCCSGCGTRRTGSRSPTTGQQAVQGADHQRAGRRARARPGPRRQALLEQFGSVRKLAARPSIEEIASVPGIGRGWPQRCRRAAALGACNHGSRGTAMSTADDAGGHRHHHRHVRGGPEHRGQVAGGPRLVRRRQPAARPAAHDGRPGGQVEGRGQPDRRRWSTCAAARSPRDLKSAISELDARGVRPRAWSSSRPADDTLVRRFDSERRPHPLQEDGRVVGRHRGRARAAARASAARRTWCSTRPRSTCTSCGPGCADFFGGGAGGRAEAVRRLVRLQVRPAGGRRPGGRLPVPAQPALDSRARPADGPGRARYGSTCCASPAPRSSSTLTLELLRVIAGRATSARASGSSTLAVGCTGGKHRSVAMAEELAARLAAAGLGRSQVRAPGSGSGVSSCGDWRRRAVALGGGHGLAASLSALRRVTGDLTAIVTVADDGGSSGVLRRDFGVLPPATCGWRWPRCAATTPGAPPGAGWCSTGSPATASWAGTRSATVLIVALWELLGDTVAGPGLGRAGCSAPHGRVLPMAVGAAGHWPPRWRAPTRRARARSARSAARRRCATHRRVRSVSIHAAAARPARRARGGAPRSLDADWVVLGPGSWFTSVLPASAGARAGRRADHHTAARRLVGAEPGAAAGRDRGILTARPPGSARRPRA